MKRKGFFSGWPLVISPACFLACASAHRFLLGTTEYVSSLLIPCELILMCALGFQLFLQAAFLCMLCIEKRWQKSIMIGTYCIIGAAAWIAAFFIDSPTLIYLS